MSHTRAMSLCWLCPCCKMWRWQAKYKCVLDFKKHEIDGAERKAGEHTVAGPMAPSVMDGCQPLQCHPISWGHTTGGHVSLEVSHQNSQPHKLSNRAKATKCKCCTKWLPRQTVSSCFFPRLLLENIQHWLTLRCGIACLYWNHIRPVLFLWGNSVCRYMGGVYPVMSPRNLLYALFTDLLMVYVVSDFSSEAGNDQLWLQLLLYNKLRTLKTSLVLFKARRHMFSSYLTKWFKSSVSTV